MEITLNGYAEICHEANKQWWRDIETGEPIIRNRGELLALIHSEVSEALEGMLTGAMDSHLPHRASEEVELADVLIRVFDYTGGIGIDLDIAYEMVGNIPEFPCINEYVRESSMTALRTLVDLPFTPTKKMDWYVGFHFVISEALEGARKHTVTGNGKIRIPTEDFALAKLVALIFSYSLLCGLDIEGAFEDKMEYNAKRADHKPENRAKEGGKKF